MKNQIAQYYESANRLNANALQAYTALAQECSRMAWNLRNNKGLTLAVRVSDESEPYATAKEMFESIDSGLYVVSRANSQHPLWTPEQNVMFRVVHDILGHYNARAGFSWRGEVDAYMAQRGQHSSLAQSALFTEIIGQTAYFSVHKAFPDQKAFIYPGEYQNYIHAGEK